jgi:prevent-host-death family protein
MKSVGSFEAKTHLSQLLERVARGEKILITKHGRPAAMLVPPEVEQIPDVREVIRRMKEFRRRKGPTLGPDLTIRDLMEVGRRY